VTKGRLLNGERNDGVFASEIRFFSTGIMRLISRNASSPPLS
jgi:hypothetical protein